MIFGSRFVRIIFITCFIVLIALNLWFWIIPRSAVAIDGRFDVDMVDQVQHYKGFGWFFDRISEFPFISGFLDDCADWMKNTPFDTAQIAFSINPLDTILGIMKLFISPLVFIGFFLKNIILTVWWVFKFLGLAIFS